MKMRKANDLFVPKLCFSNHCFRNFVFFSVIRLIQFNRGFMPHFFQFWDCCMLFRAFSFI